METNEYNKNNMLYSGCICKNFYLFCISNEGNVFQWDLKSQILINKIFIKNFTLYDCLLWSNTFLIISSRNQENNNIRHFTI